MAKCDVFRGSAAKLLVVVPLLIVVMLPSAHADAVSWSYHVDDGTGPKDWHLSYPDCGGTMQSPIEIETKYVLYDPDLELFDISGYKNTTGVNMTLVNKDGHTAEVIYSGREIKLRGGSLPTEYTLDQFHFHWGAEDGRGSEHGVDGAHFPMELHIVHHQSRLDNVSVAAPRPFGLAVIGFFFKVGKHNAAYDKLLNHFDKIIDADTNSGNEVPIPAFPLTDLLPSGDRMDYFRYPGSLTTPPCYESVIWSLATERIEISEEQLNKFRELHETDEALLVDDFRPAQSRNSRTVTTTYNGDNNAGVHFTASTTIVLLLGLVMPILGVIFH